MKTIAHQHSELHYSPVYLSGLKPLVRIYREQDKGQALGTGFGLPLVQVCQGAEIVGFSAVHITGANRIAIGYFGKAGFDLPSVREEMEQRAQQELHHSFGHVPDLATMQQQITRLIQWLNNCN